MAPGCGRRGRIQFLPVKLVIGAVFVVLMGLTACSLPENKPDNQTPTTVVTRESPAQATPTRIVEPQVDSTSTLAPTSIPTEEPVQPVLVISFDGAGAERVYALMEEGYLPTFNGLFQNGVRAESVRTVDPSLTAPAHASMVTGRYPNQTGIVSNLYHHPTDSFYWYRYGFTQPLDGIDPLWVTASREGLTTAALFFAGGTPFLPGQAADYTIAYGVRDAYSSQLTLTLSALEEPWEGDLPESFSPILQADWVIAKVAQVFLLAADGTDDGQENYDTFFLNIERSLDGISPQSTGEWRALVVDPARGAGAYFLIQDVFQENGSWQLRLYHSGVYHNAATPRALLEALDERFGPFPAGADAYALEHGWITLEDYFLMLERSAQWMAEVTGWVYQTYQPDLTFTWQEAFDAAGHAFTPRLPWQPGYDADMEAERQENFLRAAQSADRALERMLADIPVEEVRVLVVSDHGMAPVHTTVNLNTLLEEAGLLVLDERDYVVVEESQVIAFASGGAAHFYINLLGRDQDGIVPEEDYQALQDKLFQLLSELVYPETGELVFSRLLRRQELAEIHLDHLHSGDIFAQANPGFDLDSHRGRWRLFEPTSYSGQHGYDSALPEMGGILIASGPGLVGEGTIIPMMRMVDIAPTIASWLGLSSQDGLDGVPVPVFLP